MTTATYIPASRAAPLQPAHAWFFPAAALYAAIIVPLSLQAMTGQAPWLGALATGLGHAHEMLFGFALAVVAGYLLGPQPRARLLVLIGLWAGGRLALLAPAAPWLGAVTDTAFAAALAALVAPKFLGAAKKLRNQAFAPVLLGICLTAALSQLAEAVDAAWVQRLTLLTGALLFALLLLFMGGRIIAPAAAGAMHRQGLSLEARVQPRIEGALIVLMAAAVLLLLLPGGTPPAGLAIAAAGLLALVRLGRWRLWSCRGRPDLLCLGIGYGWLGLGLLLVGTSLLRGVPPTAALHLITVGALGTLTSGVMARMRLQRAKHDPAQARALIPITGLIAVAALLRAAGGIGLSQPFALYWLAALAWSLSFLLLTRLLMSVPAR